MKWISRATTDYFTMAETNDDMINTENIMLTSCYDILYTQGNDHIKRLGKAINLIICNISPG